MFSLKKIVAVSLIALFVLQHVSWSYCLCFMGADRPLSEQSSACACHAEEVPSAESEECGHCGDGAIWDLGYFDFPSQGFSGFGSAVALSSATVPEGLVLAEDEGMALRSADLSLWERQARPSGLDWYQVFGVWLL